MADAEGGPYRYLGSVIFDYLCERSGLGSVALREHLARLLERPGISRQTIAAWRAGERPVPYGAVLAIQATVSPSRGELLSRVASRLDHGHPSEEPTLAILEALWRD